MNVLCFLGTAPSLWTSNAGNVSSAMTTTRTATNVSVVVVVAAVVVVVHAEGIGAPGQCCQMV